MKRTKHINQDAFRKVWRTPAITPVALAISATLFLAGCEQADQSVSMYQNADDCAVANPELKSQCTTAYNNAIVEAARTAPKYATKEDCVAEFGEAQCTVAPQSSPSEGVQTAQAQQSGSMWMPLLAGYMFGRMMGGNGFAQQPLFTSKTASSPMQGKFVDATGRSYGPATYGRTTTVDKKAFTPKPATTTTITRGGFGETVAKQSAMSRTNSNASSSRSNQSRSYGS